MTNIEWIEVPGGMCWFGDQARPITVPTLLWSRTPITCGHLHGEPSPDRPDLPATEVDHATAAALAAGLGGRLPRSVEWEWMASGPQRRRWPWGEQPWYSALANLRDSGWGRVTAVTAHQAGATPEGVLDAAGNVWEWTASQVMGEGFIIRGGSYSSPELYARCTFLNAAPAQLRSPGVGFRVVRQP